MESIADPAAAVTQALADPLGYPPLRAMAMPGDRVVLVLADGVPCLAEMVAGVIHSLLEAGVDADGIEILLAHADDEKRRGDPCRLLPQEIRDRVSVVVHDPSEREKLAYLATTNEGQAVWLHRALTDADLVLPIGCLRASSVADYFGLSSPIYPTFSDTKTLLRFHSPKTLDARGRRRKHLRNEADEVAWLLGANFTIQVIPGPGDHLLGVLAGEIGEVRRRGREQYAAAWRRTAPRRADLVVAALEGGPERQTWENLGQALAAGAALVEPGGAIAVCCELTAVHGPAIGWLAGARSRDDVLARIRKECPTDAVPAIQLVNALEQGSVYLLSGLEAAMVEDLEITPIADADEVVRLISRHGSCIILSNAPYAVVGVEDDKRIPL